MSKPQFVLEEALEAYLGRLATSWNDRMKVLDSIVDLNTGILIGLKAARGEILRRKTMPIPIRLNVGKIRTDLEEVLMPVKHTPGFGWLRRFEEDLLLFADRFKTRRVYCAEFTIDRSRDMIFRLDRYYKFFTFNDRALAYDLARHNNGHVQIYNFANLINHSLEWVEHVPSPNRYEAVELWKTFNTCDMCRAEVQCVDAQVYGRLGRVCKSCIDKYCQFPVQRILFKKALARHLKTVKDTTCNCLFCRNLNKEPK